MACGPHEVLSHGKCGSHLGSVSFKPSPGLSRLSEKWPLAVPERLKAIVYGSEGQEPHPLPLQESCALCFFPLD